MATLAPALVFTGFMGAGKSRALRHAKAAGLDTADTDLLLAEELGSSIPDFFASHGEEEFRRREAELVLRVLGEGHDAVALGGGAVLSAEVREALRGHTVVWLRVPADELWRRASRSERPLARDETEFLRLQAEREPLYRELADAVLLSADALPGALEHLRALDGSPADHLIWAQAASGSYPVWIGSGILPMVSGAGPGRPFCVSDTTRRTGSTPPRRGRTSRSPYPPASRRRRMAQAERVLEALAGAGATRSDHVVALGGGVIGDLAGFCASAYQRGIPVVQVPTSLLAQVDSAYGGKTGVDLGGAKNYVGAYHQPAAVIVDIATLFDAARGGARLRLRRGDQDRPARRRELLGTRAIDRRSRSGGAGAAGRGLRGDEARGGCRGRARRFAAGRSSISATRWGMGSRRRVATRSTATARRWASDCSRRCG